MTCCGKVNFAPAENIGFEHKEKVELHMQFRIFRGISTFSAEQHAC